MKISIASDHGGYALKEDLRSWLTEQGHEVEDFGCHGLESCDYADFCEPAARAAAEGKCDRGIVICTTVNIIFHFKTQAPLDFQSSM